MYQVDLKPHQAEAVQKLHNGSILSGGVGTGKTRVAMRYYILKEAPKDVYVITTAKKRDSRDWESEAIKHGVGTSRDASFTGVLKVDSWNNLWRYADVEEAFFIFDEQRLVGSGAWVGTFRKIAKKNSWILLSATPGDTWLDYIPVFVANGMYKNKTEFLREHVVYSRYSKYPKVERYIAVGRLVRNRNALLVSMPYERHTRRHIQDVIVNHDEPKLEKAIKTRWDPFLNEPMKDVAALFRVMRRIVNSDPSRVSAVRTLMTVHPRLIVFYNFDYELEMLRSIIESPISIETSSEISKQQSDNTQTSAVFQDVMDSSMSASSERSDQSLSHEDLSSLRIFSSDHTKNSSPSGNEITHPTTCKTSTESDTRSLHDSEKNQSKNSSTPLSQEDTHHVKQSSTRSSGKSRTFEKQSTESNSTTTSLQKMPTSSTIMVGGQSISFEITENQENESLGIKSNSDWGSENQTKPSSIKTLTDTSSQIHKGKIQADGDGGSTTIYPDISISEKKPSSEFSQIPNTLPISGQDEPSLETKPSQFSELVLAEWNGHKHEPIPTSDHWIYLVQYTAGAEGWNCIETNAVCFYSLNYSYRVFEQCQGRIDRLNTKWVDLYYYVLMSNSVIDKMIRKALAVKKRFNEPKNEADLRSRSGF